MVRLMRVDCWCRNRTIKYNFLVQVFATSLKRIRGNLVQLLPENHRKRFAICCFSVLHFTLIRGLIIFFAFSAKFSILFHNSMS